MSRVSGKLSIWITVCCIVLVLTGLYIFFFSPLGRLFRSDAELHARPNIAYQQNLKTLHLKGQVKSVREENYKQEVPFDELENHFTRENYEFDQRGNLTRHVIFIDEAFAMDYAYLAYDDANNYTERKRYTESGSLMFHEVNKLDSLGRLYEASMYDTALGYRFVVQYTAIPGGYIERGHQEYPVSPTVHINRQTYDSAKRELYKELSVEDGTEHTESKEVWGYDKNGNMIIRTRYKPKDVLDFRYTCSFNSNDLPVRQETTSYAADGTSTVSMSTYVYDDQGSVVEYTQLEKGAVDKRSYRARYTYDAKGNWMHRDILRLDGTLKTSVDRVITYY